MSEWKLLRELKKRGKAHWTQLGLPKSSVSALLSSLVKKGLVKRIDQGFYQLTEEGERTLSQSCPPLLLAFIIAQIEFVLEDIENPSKELVDELVMKEVKEFCPLLYLEIVEKLRMSALDKFLYGKEKSFLDTLYEMLERY